jgi:iron complex outermembrane recepter protein
MRAGASADQGSRAIDNLDRGEGFTGGIMGHRESIMRNEFVAGTACNVPGSSATLAITIALALGVGGVSTALAQQQQAASPRVLEEVVVTAQRRAEDVQNIPVAVSAFDGVRLDQLGIGAAFDLARHVPNFIVNNNVGLGTANSYSIRGLNNTESIATFDPPVGSYVNDVFVGRQNANNFTFFDVERVEVLRGPQGTLFGRNTTGGAVNVIMRRPAEEFGGYVEAGWGRFGRSTVRGSVDIPLSPQFLTKVSAYWIEDSGFLDNVTTGERLSFEDNWGVRADLRWLATDSVTWDLAVDYTDTKKDRMTSQPDGDGGFSSRTGLRRGTSLAGIVNLVGDKQNIPYGNQVESYSVTSRVNIELDVGDLELITGWRSMEQKFLLDFFNFSGPAGGFSLANDGRHDQFSQEIKLTGAALDDRMGYVVGVYYYDEDNRTDWADVFDLFLAGAVPFSFPFVLNDRLMRNTTESWAVYGQIDYDLSSEWILTAGLRYTDEQKDIAYDRGFFTTEDLAAFGTPLELSTQLWTPRLALRYQPTDDLGFFASVTRGFKSGGWNARGGAPELIRAFGPERVWSYELGMRSEWLDGQLRLNSTAFLSDVSDFQLPSAFVRADGVIEFLTRNAADMRTVGLEVELVAVPGDNLTVFLNAGIQDAEYRNLPADVLAQQQACRDGIAVGANCGRGIVTVNGDIAVPTRAPRYQATAGGDYIFRLTPQLELVPNLAVTRYGRHKIDTANAQIGIVDGFSHIDAAVELRDPEGVWRVRAECRNCSNRIQPGSVFAGQLYFRDPRTWMLSARLRF